MLTKSAMKLLEDRPPLKPVQKLAARKIPRQDSQTSIKGLGNIQKTQVNQREKASLGGAEGNRTPDLLHAMQALSQLSYGPRPMGWLNGVGIEPSSSRSSY
jgi:hypothetical protein